MRRLALFACLVALVAFTGTASGALERTPRTVIENALAKVRPAPDLSVLERNGSRVRVIVTLADPPLAEAAVARRFGGLGTRQKLNLRSAFSRSYVAELRSAQARAIASLRR
ncbi:MAG: hypothetical protein ACREKH_18160, partial [Candidatus Rokuibacteriota bacterium]